MKRTLYTLAGLVLLTALTMILAYTRGFRDGLVQTLLPALAAAYIVATIWGAVAALRFLFGRH